MGASVALGCGVLLSQSGSREQRGRPRLRARRAGLQLSVVTRKVVRMRPLSPKPFLEDEDQRVQELILTVAQSASDAIVATNATGAILYTNPALESMFGHEPGGLLGQPIMILLAEGDAAGVAARLAEASASEEPGGLATVELTGRRADGSEFPIEASRGVHAGPDGLLITAVIRDVSVRHRTEQRLRGLLESAPDATVVVNQRGEIEFVNALAVSMFGFEREELIGEPVEQLVPERSRGAHPRFCAHYFADPQTRPLGTGAELSARRKDGSEFPVEITLSHVRTEDGLLVSSAIRDITERRRAEEAIARLAAIVESSHDAIIGKTLQGQITSWNDAAERAYGYSAAEAIGQHVSLLLPPECKDELSELLVRVGAGERVSHLESTRRRKDGQIIDVSVTVSPIKDATGQVVGASTVERDITEHRRAERERVELLEARARAESANRAKSEFLARMSHELRTPLNAIIGFTQLVERDGLTPRQSEHTGYVLTAAGHLLELINEVLQLTTLETNHVTISPEPVSLSETVSEALALVGPQAREHGVALCTNTETLAHDRHVRADRQRLKRVWLNLLSNAIKYNRPGGRVDVSFAFTEGGRARTTIADTGIGIAPEQLAKLFEPFERLGAEHTEVEGTGLGLALSKRLIEALEGSIEISSEPGIGTVVTVELALASEPVATGTT